MGAYGRMLPQIRPVVSGVEEKHAMQGENPQLTWLGESQQHQARKSQARQALPMRTRLRTRRRTPDDVVYHLPVFFRSPVLTRVAVSPLVCRSNLCRRQAR